jgi:uncharacterized protein (TIGR03084 family)
MLGLMADLGELVDDLRATQSSLRDLLVALEPAEWDRPTPAAGWSVRHQVRHLAQGEELSRLAATDEPAFQAQLVHMLEHLDEVEATTTAADGESSDALVERWWAAAEAVRSAVLALPDGARVPWAAGPMSRASFLGARVMETFAHGHDIGAATQRSAGFGRALPHVARLGVVTRDFAFANRGLPIPETTLRVELYEPDLTFGSEGADDEVRGQTRDFCLLVTQRIHRDDTGLMASGPHAEEWLRIAQCFAGPPTDGPPPAGRRAAIG